MYRPIDIANWFLVNVDRASGDAITHLKLQKLVYYAQAWALVFLEKPLFNEDFEAWTHGPVLRSLYEEFKGNAWQSLPPPAPEDVVQLEEDVIGLLIDVMDGYGEFSAKALEDLTHEELPWKAARGDLPAEASSSNKITKPAMYEFYKSMSDELN